MGTLAIVEIPVSETALSETIRRVPDVHIELERSVAAGLGASASLWVHGATRDELEAALEADDSVKDFHYVTAENEKFLYDVTFTADASSVRQTVCENHGVVQEAYSDGESWTLRLRFPSREHLSNTKTAFEANGLDTSIVRIHDVEETSSAAIGLTKSQREALQTALEHGYYEVPRESDLKDLADELGESHQSLSEKLRRAHQAVVAATVTDTPPTPKRTN